MSNKAKKTGKRSSSIGRGRGYKFGAARKVLVKSLKAGSTITAACHNARISRDLFYHYKDILPDFAEEVKKALNVRNDVVVDSLYYNAVRRKDVGAQKFWLTNRVSKEWKNLNHETLDMKQPVMVVYENAPKSKEAS